MSTNKIIQMNDTRAYKYKQGIEEEGPCEEAEVRQIFDEIMEYEQKQLAKSKKRKQKVLGGKSSIGKTKMKIKRASLCVGGISIAKLAITYSEAIDTLVFTTGRRYLLGSSTALVGIPIPRWFMIYNCGAVATTLYFCIYKKYIKKDGTKKGKGGKKA